MAYLGLVPSEHSSGEKRRIGGITKAGNSRLRKLLIESGWHYRHYMPSKRLTMRRKGQDTEIITYADKAGKRLNKKYTKMMHNGKMPQKTVTAIARELSGFIWGMMVGKTSLA
jgi:transposase